MIKLSIYFDGQFWVGLVERQTQQGLLAGRFIFGPEPSEGEIWEFIHQDLDRVIASCTVALVTDPTHDSIRNINPKRLMRLVNKEKLMAGPSCAAQDALRIQQEANKKERKVQSKQHKLEDEQRRRDLAREKAKKKHRGH